MTLHLEDALLRQLRRHAEDHYPNEGAGLILGHARGEVRRAIKLIPLTNRSEEEARRYRIDPQDMLTAELEAERLGLDILGVFHSHPDVPAEPSPIDTQSAFPWFSYVITNLQAGKTCETRSWRLNHDRSRWSEEHIAGQTPDNSKEVA